MKDNPIIPGDEFAGRYRIERELGRGGAAIVYLAHDIRQDRQVAVKVLHKELGQAIGARRFLREIKHSSSLHHPHLLVIHDSGESDGFLYYVMPYMRDGSLRARIAKEKQLAVDEALRVTRQVGEALAYAHSRGIMHRDIKPDNVLFSVDHACLADFGIARAIDSVAADTLTSTGLVVGTPAYMSPEQASGEKEVDARSDQYSLACLLYEMITGLPPFIGATMQSVISQRFTQPPPSMRAHRPSVPDHVERAVKRALAVAPADRFGSVTDFIAALHTPGAVAEPVSVHSIRRRWFAVGAAAALVTLAVVAARPGADWVRGAWRVELDTAKFVVLPFVGDAPGSPSGADVAASLHTSLDRWNGLALVDRVAAQEEFESHGGGSGSLEDAIAVAEGLGAGKLIWGTVANAPGGARVSAALYDVRTGTSRRDTLYLPHGAAADSSLRKMLNALLRAPSFPADFDDGQNGTASYAAWQAYGAGIVALNAGDFDGAQRRLAEAVDIDPTFAAANVWLAHASSITLPKAQHEWSPVARRAAALRGRLRPRDVVRAEGLLALSRVELDTACDKFGNLVQSDSADAHAWISLGECLGVDSRVLHDARSPSLYKFATSMHASGHAFLRALELNPRLHSPQIFTRLRRAFKTSLNDLRIGPYVTTDSVLMYAYPVASGDTIAFVPFPSDVLRSGRAADPNARARAIDRSKAVLLRAARAWVSVAPRSGDAFEALAAVLETNGELRGRDPNTSALASVQRARSLVSGPKAVALASAHVRLLLKTEEFVLARALADSLSRQIAPDDFPVVRSVTAAVLGRPAEMSKGIIANHFGDMASLEAPLMQSGAEFLAYAAVGACSSRLVEIERRLESLLASYVSPTRMSAVRRELTTDALSLSASCANGASASRVEQPAPLIARMQQALAAGRLADVRSGFDSLARIRRGSRGSQTSPDYLVRESWLRAVTGDTVGAMRQLDLVLNALPALGAGTLENPVQVASLIRAMALRADLAALTGDEETARRWAGVVATLWSSPDPALGVTVTRMRTISTSGRWSR